VLNEITTLPTGRFLSSKRGVNAFVTMSEKLSKPLLRILSDAYPRGTYRSARNAGQPLEELVKAQAISVDLREAVMACLCGGRVPPLDCFGIGGAVKNLGVCASRASVTAALAELALELELSSSRARGACSNEEPNGSWRPNQSS
jgi:hypothetical protein